MFLPAHAIGICLLQILAWSKFGTDMPALAESVLCAIKFE